MMFSHIAGHLLVLSEKDFQKGQNIMEVFIKIGGQAVSVEVKVEVCEYLDQAKHKDEKNSAAIGIGGNSMNT